MSRSILSTPELDRIFDELRREFIAHISMTEFSALDRDTLLTGFDVHLFRFQQMFLLLKDLSLSTNALSTQYLASAIIPKGFKKGDAVPLIIQRDDYLRVEMGNPPLSIDFSEDSDVITLASVQVFPGDPIPFSGKTAVVTTQDADTELALASYDMEKQVSHLMWGRYIMRIAKDLRPKSSLN